MPTDRQTTWLARKSYCKIGQDCGGLTKPVVDPQVRKKVPDKHVVPAKLVYEEVQHSAHDCDADITQHDKMSVLVLEQRRTGVKVADTTAETVELALATALTLALVVIVAGDVGQKVVGPSDKLLADEHGQGVDGGLLGQLAHLVGQLAQAGGLLLAGAGHKDHVTLQVAGGLVMLAVGHLPGEIGHEESRVDNPSDQVIVRLGGREGAVAALVGKDPQASAEQALEECVQAPESKACRVRGDVLGCHEVVKKIEGGGEAGAVTENVPQAQEAVTLETVLGDGVTELLDGIVRDLEGVAIGVDQLAVRRLLFACGIEGGHGRERRRGGGGPRGVEGRSDASGGR